ncbi:MAG: hypothetical protein K0B85_05735 [Coriobacteriia bacterium]|nr:hypothetical protein [Coriobacteriia bacterium]
MRIDRTDIGVLAFTVVVSVALVASAALAPDFGVFAAQRFALWGVLIVATIARVGGVRAGLTAALGVFVFAVILEPDLRVGLPVAETWIDLVLILIVAGAVGFQTGELRQREDCAVQQEHEARSLARLGARFISGGPIDEVVTDALGEVASLVSATHLNLIMIGDSVARALPESSRVLADDPDVEPLARWAAQHGMIIGPEGIGDWWPTGTGLLTTASPEQAGACLDRRDVFVPALVHGAAESVIHLGPKAGDQRYTRMEYESVLLLSALVALFIQRERLQQKTAEAEAREEADRLKTSLLSSVSHELKTPLAAVKATITNLMPQYDTIAREDLRADLASVEQATGVLERQIGDLLDISRFESDSWTPRIEWNDVADLWPALRARAPVDARARLVWEPPGDLPPARFDLVQIGRALYHIVENALVYGPPDGEVRLVPSVCEQELRIAVEDRGPGVPAAERERVFEKFQRGKEGSRSPSGTGLGLTIAAEIVRHHGGRIEIEDVEPRGARFTVVLPVEIEE